MSDIAFFAGVFALIMAPFLGSFFALVADRLPRGEPLATGRSQCRDCGRILGFVDLVPLASYVILKGKCRTCGQPIPHETIMFEVAALLLAFQAVMTVGWGWLILVTVLLGLALLTLAVIDIRHFYLPDVLTLPLIAMGILTSLAEPRLDLLSSSLGAAIGYGSFALVAWLYRKIRGRDGLGLGDAKLFAAAGAFVGWQGLPLVLLVASTGGLVVILLLRLRGRVISNEDIIPFGPFLALGFWLVWLYAPPVF